MLCMNESQLGHMKNSRPLDFQCEFSIRSNMAACLFSLSELSFWQDWSLTFHVVQVRLIFTKHLLLFPSQLQYLSIYFYPTFQRKCLSKVDDIIFKTQE